MTDFLSVESTATLEETQGPPVRRAHSIIKGESSSSGEAQIDVEWVTNVVYTHPPTWTQEEAAAQFVGLFADLARTRSIQIIGGLPDAVAPVILPQLEEIVDYEMRSWLTGRELREPGIKERWVSLPIVE